MQSASRSWTRVSPFGSHPFPVRVIEIGAKWRHDARMRVNLSTRSSSRLTSRAGTIPLTLTIRPACGIPGDYELPFDGEALLRLLRRQTDLPGYILEGFERKVRTLTDARLMGVELDERVLTDIGYFID